MFNKIIFFKYSTRQIKTTKTASYWNGSLTKIMLKGRKEMFDLMMHKLMLKDDENV